MFSLTDSFWSAVRWKRMRCSNWSNSLLTALNLATHFSDLFTCLSSLSGIPGTCSAFLWPRAGWNHGRGGRQSSTRGMPSFNYLTPATVMGSVHSFPDTGAGTFATCLLSSICKAGLVLCQSATVTSGECGITSDLEVSSLSLSYLFYQVGN